MIYDCVDGDRIDLIVLNHYGDLDNLMNVIESNKHLFKLPLLLVSGLSIQLPLFEDKIDITIVKPQNRKALW